MRRHPPATPGSPGDSGASGEGGPDRAPAGSGPPGEGGPGNDPAEGRRRLHDLGRQAAGGVAAGAQAAQALGRATESMRLEATATGLRGDRVLAGHVLGTHLVLAAQGLHGPRQTPVVAYLFADAVALRPSDDAPMSTVPLFGLHMVFPPLAVTRWLYKAGRIEHADLDLVEVTRQFEAAIPGWTVDDFAGADPKLQVHRTAELVAPAHVYQRLGFAHLWLPVPGTRPVRLKSTLPAPAEAFTRLWDLCQAVSWPRGITMEAPRGGDEPPDDEAGPPS